MTELSNEYIRGLIEGEGCFTFCTNYNQSEKFERKAWKVPTFVVAMHIRDKDLLEAVRNHLRLPNKLYEYQPSIKDGYKRGRAVRLIVREYFSLRDIIIPFFYKKLKGHKGRQFKEWLEKMGTDPQISFQFRQLYFLYISGHYEIYPKVKFWEKNER